MAQPGDKQYVGIKVDPETAEWFRKRAKGRGLQHGQYVRHLLQQDEQVDVSSVKGADGELLVTYSAIVHTPVRLQGTVSRWQPTEEPPDEEEEPPSSNNSSE